MKHITKDGNQIELKDLETGHLKNIIALLERKAAVGITVIHGGGGYDAVSIWYDEEDLTDEDALKHMGYYEYKKELKKRIKS